EKYTYFLPYILLKYHFELYQLTFLEIHLVLLRQQYKKPSLAKLHHSSSWIRTYHLEEFDQIVFSYLLRNQLLHQLYRHHQRHEDDRNHNHDASQGQTLPIAPFVPSLNYDDKMHYFPLQLNIRNIVYTFMVVSLTLSGMVLAYWEPLKGNHLNDLNQLYPPFHKHYHSKFLHSYRLLFSFPEL